ncbi:hypothetical protein [Dyadobacter chenhuakuii]|uniref:Uncharacterized protein n=1 Tax=Dyadobacter chenhuakuii TaxID=2909339 RepID=A0A9X1TUF7_9BACT|nr:hypothetical protein [Dyadobacter chenhuakuii]MCF2495410.1 hypothetical protein [Dyadobacter chenhuakuii]MCF2500125.1 hypothetical protein [Dyadobacter chenhuakuii]USJ29448.1 hypothetical protein NFI80_16365 [Dyadobacter chenhuakuii]
MKAIYYVGKCLFIMAVYLIEPSLSRAQVSRGVDWVHGLGGNASSLEGVDNFFFGERRIIAPNRWSYTTNTGIHNMGIDVDNRTGGGTRTGRIGIGHSLGGTAIRQVSLWGSSWRGVVTMGSPLRGAQISTSASDGTNTAFVDNGRERMMAGPSVGSAVSPPIWPNLGLEFTFIQPLATLYSEGIAKWVNKKLMDSFGLEGQTAVDLKPGSTYQNSIVNQTSSVPKIFIWGNENYPILWKVVGTYAIWDSETNGVNLASDVANLYNAAVNGEEFQSWANLPMHGFHQWRKGKWEEGRNWMNTDSNEGWRHVIGASYTEYLSWYETVVTCDSYQWQACYASSPPPGYCDDYCTDQVFHSIVIYHDLPSDGVVPAASQRNIDGAWQGHHREAPGINHGEFKIPDRIQSQLNWVFDNGDGTDVFGIDRR